MGSAALAAIEKVVNIINRPTNLIKLAAFDFLKVSLIKQSNLKDVMDVFYLFGITRENDKPIAFAE
ncbi:hypothetical protein SAE01_32050 [Segetibacter aerophilus]|uniref:Uncharacterized protein n=1 Tax=Segetibacter aerophilus TaxID=670293 RepID=A0A512BFG1_9BACT|nr:hypothetical protein SAE01_32050 [Segetibacter aerophilus]